MFEEGIDSATCWALHPVVRIWGNGQLERSEDLCWEYMRLCRACTGIVALRLAC